MKKALKGVDKHSSIILLSRGDDYGRIPAVITLLTTGFSNQGGKAMKKILSLVLVLSMVLAPSAFAASPWAAGKTYGEKVSGKLAFGLTNTLLGWTKLVSTPNDYSNAGKNVWQGVG